MVRKPRRERNDRRIRARCEMMVRPSHHSARIEGNPLTLPEVEALTDGRRVAWMIGSGERFSMRRCAGLGRGVPGGGAATGRAGRGYPAWSGRAGAISAGKLSREKTERGAETTPRLGASAARPSYAFLSPRPIFGRFCTRSLMLRPA